MSFFTLPQAPTPMEPSLFYITYESCAHLNYKHSVFGGGVMGGLGRI